MQAIIENGVVANIIVGDIGGITILDNTTVVIGMTYDPINNIFAFTKEQQILAIKTQLATLDPNKQMRPIREFLLPLAVSTAASHGLTETQLYTVNDGYKRL
jgi:hypothetical protein